MVSSVFNMCLVADALDSAKQCNDAPETGIWHTDLLIIQRWKLTYTWPNLQLLLAIVLSEN